MSQIHEHGGNILSLARQHGFSPADSIDFSASINPLGFSPKVREAIVSALDNLVHYPDNDCVELKQALATFHNVSADYFAIANGSTEIIYTLPALLPGKRALIISPAFSEYSNALLQQNCEVQRLILSPRDDFALNPDILAKVLDHSYDALYLCNPGNPSGRLYPREVVRQVHDLCHEKNTLLVLDEAFMDFCEESSAKELIIASDHGIVLRSMTKFYGIPGLRLGYAMAAPALIKRLISLGAPWSVNTLAQAAGIAALSDGEYNKRSSAHVTGLREEFSRALSNFPQLSVHPSNANFLLIEINTTMTSGELKQRLLEKMILIRDCSTFTGLSNRFFRVAVRTEPENARLLACLKEILV